MKPLTEKTGVELLDARAEIVRQLNQAKLKHIERGKALAEAEKSYRTAKARKLLELRLKGMPVTIVTDIARGDEEVAELAFVRDCAKVEYTSLLEAINILKKELAVIETEIDNERRGM